MKIKETQDLWVLRQRSRLRIPDVKKSAEKYAATIEEQIRQAGLEIDGPYLFISHKLPKDSKTFFDWEICRPVKQPGRYDGDIELAHLEPIMVASKIHQGSLRTTTGPAPAVHITTSKSSLAYCAECFANSWVTRQIARPWNLRQTPVPNVGHENR